MVPYLDPSTNGPEACAQPIQLQHHSQQLLSNHISHKLLECALRDNDHYSDLSLLACNLLGVSLAHTGYSASLTALLNSLLNARAATMDTREYLWKLAPSIADYLKVRISRKWPNEEITYQLVLSLLLRVYNEAPIESQQELVAMKIIWRRHANKYKFGS